MVDFHRLIIFFDPQIDEEVAKLLQLKAQIGDDGGKHVFVLKTAKVTMPKET